MQVVNINNQRFETYVIFGEPGSGCIELNGTVARTWRFDHSYFVLHVRRSGNENANADDGDGGRAQQAFDIESATKVMHHFG